MFSSSNCFVHTHTKKDVSYSTATAAPCDGWMVHRLSDKAPLADENFEIEFRDSTGNSWFQDHFSGNIEDTRHVLGHSDSFGPMVVSVLQEKSQKSHGKYKVIVRTQMGDDFVSFNASLVRVGVLRNRPAPRDILRAIDPRLCAPDMKIFEVERNIDKLVEELLIIEKKHRVTSYKFGILYVKDGQTKEEDMFSNEHGSPSFEEFLNMLGQRVELKGWTKYRAGLDVNRNTTGTHSVYTTFEDYEIMFHVSTLLPYRKSDPQQLERKRHIGNDIGVIIYREVGENTKPYNPATIESEYNHILCVVDAKAQDPQHPSPKDKFSLSVACKMDVPPFGPEIPKPNSLKRGEYFRKLLLAKLINGENASFRAPIFSSKIRRTRLAIYQNIVDTYK